MVLQCSPSTFSFKLLEYACIQWNLGGPINKVQWKTISIHYSKSRFLKDVHIPNKEIGVVVDAIPWARLTLHARHWGYDILLYVNLYFIYFSRFYLESGLELAGPGYVAPLLF